MTAVPTLVFTARDAAFLAATAVPPPPPEGVIADFHKPNFNGIIFIVVGVFLTILAVIFTLIRLYTKAFLTRALGWDDYTCLLALLGLIIWTGTNIKMALIGMGRNSWDVLITNATSETYYHAALIANTVYFCMICVTKMSILLLYLRTFASDRKFRLTVWAVFFVLVVSHVLNWIIYWVQLTPLHCAWRSYPTDESFYEACKVNLDCRYMLVLLAALTIVLDLIILVMPCSYVWRLQMPKRQKVWILMILLAGVIVTISSTLRLAYLIIRFYVNDENDFLTEFQVNLISMVECGVAVICTCLPTLGAFLKRFAPSVLKLLSSNQVSYGARSAKRSTVPPSSGLRPERSDRRWENGLNDEDLVGGTYIELGEDGKSDQSYAMTTKLVPP